jgi:sigma-B regulation protein RsbU (phosphoserine phosphatase)
MERIYQELENARRIQKSLLPEGPPEVRGFELAGTSLPAKEVSGDFYDYLSLGENVGIVLADVSGKSVKAAMVAAMTNGMLRAEVKGQRDIWDSPGNILRDLNIALRPRLIEMMFTTMCLIVLHPEEKRLTFSNAGMPYPIVRHGGKTRELEVSGFPLGLMDDAEYSELSFYLEAGDMVILYSDGVIEAVSEADGLYQTDRLLKVLQQADSSLSAQGMLNCILKDVIEFAGDVDLFDDITIVVLRCIQSD